MLAYRLQEDDRRRFLKLGAYPGVSLKQARQLAEVAFSPAQPSSGSTLRTWPTTDRSA